MTDPLVTQLRFARSEFARCLRGVSAEDAQKRMGPMNCLSWIVQRRNGVPLGHSDSLRNMLQRSFGAPSFAAFWQYWNPIWGYGLGKFIYAPLRRRLPAASAFVTTFVISGAIHDLVTVAVRGAFAFLFTPWFFLLALGALLGRAVHLDLSGHPWLLRASVNLGYLLICLALVLLAKQLDVIP